MSAPDLLTIAPLTRRLATLVAAFVAAMGLLGLAAPLAQAHSELESITPADGTSMEQAPAQVVLTFTDKVIGEFTQVQVKGPTGDLTLPPATSSDNVVTQPLSAGLGAGTYTVTYRIVSADSHPIAGQSSFTVTVGAASSPSTTASAAAPAAPSASGSPSASFSPAPTPSDVVTPVPTGAQSGSGTSLWPWLLGSGLVVALLVAARLARGQRGA